LESIETSREPKSADGGTCFKAAPLERSKYRQNGNKPDPYVTRAMARAQSKLKSRMVQMNGGRVD
jgi:hypothetical protein